MHERYGCVKRKFLCRCLQSVIPAKAWGEYPDVWIPAYAGMTCMVTNANL
jgi:hypothetical protein